MSFRIVLNGLKGPSVQKLSAAGWDPGILRPYFNSKGVPCVALRGRDGKRHAVMARNANTLLPIDAWKKIDTAVQRVARPKLRLVNDLRAAGLTYPIPEGMGKTSLTLQRMTDPGEAIVGMDPIRNSATENANEFDSVVIPLPIIWHDVQMSARTLEVSRSGPVSFDTARLESAAQRVAEQAEKLVIGTSAYNTLKVGGGTLDGILTSSNPLSASITQPTTSGWTPALFVTELLAMIDAAAAKNHSGPFMLYFGTGWRKYLGMDYSSTTSGQTTTITLQERIAKIDGIKGIAILDYMNSTNQYKVVLVEQSSSVIQVGVGFDVTTVQWEEQGGMSLHFKVMAMMVPIIRADIENQTGIVVGSP